MYVNIVTNTKSKKQKKKKFYGVANMDCLHNKSLQNRESTLWRKVNDQLFVICLLYIE